MRIDELTPKEYPRLFPKAPHVFNSVAFTELNRHKCDEVRDFAFSDGKPRAGIIIGKRDGVWMSPFSAPYGGLTLNKRQPIPVLESIFSELLRYADSCKGVKITLPPVWYDSDLQTKSINILSRIPGIRSTADISYHLMLSGENGIDENGMTVTGRQNLRRSLEAPFEFVKASGSADSIAAAYDVIRRNHAERGYALRMSLDDVTATADVVPAEFFMLLLEGKPAAAAQVYNVAPGIAQLINWGDIREMSTLCPMNRLAYELARHYRSRGMTALDLGPATENGVPNEGLCRFKESLGCIPSLKYSFIL